MEIKWLSTKNRRIAKRTLYAGIGFISILLAVGILFSLLPLNSNVAGAVISNASYSAAGTDSQPIYANAQPLLSPVLRIRTTNAQRQAAAARIAASGAKKPGVAATGAGMNIAMVTPGGIPDYFGMIPNYANSPVPSVDPGTGAISGGIRKFVDSLPGLGPAGANNIGKYIPIATADTTTYNGSDYYEIGVVEYTEKMHSDLNPTILRGYIQLSTTTVPGSHIPLKYVNGANILTSTGAQVYAVDNPHYLGPLIIAQKDRPVRVKFTNYLPTGAGGNLFLPVDTTVVGAGDGPLGCTLDANGTVMMGTCIKYTQNRVTIHLHGGNTPWISDGTQDQWTTPAGEITSYPKGVSVRYVPDMDNGTEPNGTMTFYYTNQQGARLMFYHDHAYGLTRLNVYAGVAGAYLVQDPVEQALVNGGTIPGTAMTVSPGTIPAEQIPLVIQDRTFLDNPKLATQDPTWPFTLNTSRSDLWWPHVYMPAQNPAFGPLGVNQMGRWDYGPWMVPPVNVTNGPVANPLNGTALWEYALNPGVPNPYIVPEAFVDTSIVNGNVYPYLPVGQKAYRFRILNAANDRTFNLQLYYASTAGPFVLISGGNGSGASAIATVNATGSITGITITGGGAGYTSPPNVSIFDAPMHTPKGSGATATATINITFGNITGITVTNGSSGYSVPTMCRGNAVQNHSLCTEISMVPAVPGAASFPADWNATTGNATNPYSILDGRAEGVPDPNSTGPSMIQIGTEGGLLPAPVNISNRPLGFDYNNSIPGVLNVREKALFLGGAERADVIVDFSGVPDNSTLILYSDAPSPLTGSDSRYDYFTDAPDQTLIGGAASTIPGYGPNTRTVMQFRVNASIATAPAFSMTNLTNALPVAYAQSQGTPLVPEVAYNTAFTASYVNNYVGLAATNISFIPAGQTSAITMNLAPKSINDGFDPTFGGLLTILGVEIPATRWAIPYNNFDPPTEIIRNSNAAVPIGTLGDGTQIWRLYHNSVDTHPMHWHMFNLQVINRINQNTGAIIPPDPSELGWRETVRANPLEDMIVALRPIKPNVPFDLPNNIRSLDVTSPLGSMPAMPFMNIDPTNQTANVTNRLVNFGEEYVWHCHILGHEESMIMRPMVVVVTPNAPSTLTATQITTGVALDWTDNSTNEINFIVQRATSAAGPWTNIATVPSTTGPGKGTTVTYNDILAVNNTTYYYLVNASNIVGDTTVYAAPAAGYPYMVANSTGVTASVTLTPASTGAPAITSSSPASPVNDIVGATRAFNVVVNQTANVTWYINGSMVQTNTSVSSAIYTNLSANPGSWNVTASATNVNGSAMNTWNWIVSAVPASTGAPSIISSSPASPVNDIVGAIRSFNVVVNQTANVTWYINGSLVQTNTSVSSAIYTNLSAKSGSWNVSAVATNVNGSAMNTWNWIVSAVPASRAPVITSSSPTSPVNDIVGATRAFNVRVNQTANVTWYINGSIVQTNTSVSSAIYTNRSANPGIWNVSAVATNVNGSAMKTWTWIVSAAPAPAITSSSPTSPVNDIVGAARAFNVRVNQTANVTWYINGSIVQTNTSVSSAIYTNRSANPGIWNVSAVASNVKGSAMKTWTWIVTTTASSPVLSISATPTTVQIHKTITVTFNVTSNSMAVNGATVTLSGAGVNTSGRTNAIGMVKISMKARSTGTITATASMTGYTSGTTTLNVTDVNSSTIIHTNTTANKTCIINATNSTSVHLAINATIGANVSVNISTNSNASSMNVTPATSSYGLGQNQSLVGQYISVNVSGLNASDLNYINLTVYYNLSDLDGDGDNDLTEPLEDLNESALKLYWFNPNTSLWMPLGPGVIPYPDYASLGGPTVFGGERNTIARYISVTVNHFSTFVMVSDLVTVPTVDSGGSSGSSSGGSTVVTGESYDNIAKSESYDKDLVTNMPVKYAFKTPELGVYEIALTGKENENGITMRAEVLKDTSKQVTAKPLGTVYKNINIMAGTKKMKEALIRFRVENSWLGNNSFAGSDVKMLRWNGSQWTALETSQTTKDDTYTYYEAKTNAFSPFAISAIKGSVVAAVPTSTPAVVVTETPGLPTGTVTPSPSPTNKVPGLEFVLTVALILVAYMSGRKRR